MVVHIYQINRLTVSTGQNTEQQEFLHGWWEYKLELWKTV